MTGSGQPFPSVFDGRLAPPGASPLSSFEATAPPRVSAAVPDGAGGWFLAGEFQGIGEAARESLAHVLADGRVDHGFDADLQRAGTQRSAKVHTLVRSGGTL